MGTDSRTAPSARSEHEAAVSSHESGVEERRAMRGLADWRAVNAGDDQLPVTALAKE
jgi:hypothetical protein